MFCIEVNGPLKENRSRMLSNMQTGLSFNGLVFLSLYK